MENYKYSDTGNKYIEILVTDNFEIRSFEENRFVLIYPSLSFYGHVFAGVRQFQSLKEIN